MFFETSWAKIFFGKTTDESKDGLINEDDSLETPDVSDKVCITHDCLEVLIYVTTDPTISLNFRVSSIGLKLSSNCQMMIFAEEQDMMQFIILVFKNV